MVTSTRASPSARRAAIGSGPNAENSGQKTLPFFERAERRDVELGDAPGEHEDALAATDAEPLEHVGEAVRARGELAVAESRRAPLLPSQRSAMRSRRAPAACRSTASCAMLSPRPPGRPSSARRASAQEKRAYALA